VGPNGQYKYIYQTNFNIPVQAGQQVYCSVQYVNNKTAGYIYFANETTGQNTSITVPPPPGAAFNGDTVEWIMEDPNGGEPNVALAKFTPVAFTSAIACSGSILGSPPGTIGNPNAGSTTAIETGTGTILTKTSVGSFAVTIDFV
jgi:hypothetical protein